VVQLYIRLSGNDLIPSLLFFFYLFCTGSLFFEIIHHTLHRCTKTSHSLLQHLARIHHFRHLYFTRHLKFDRKYVREDRFQVLPIELAIQIAGSVLGYVIASLVTPDGLVCTTRNHLWSTLAFEILRYFFDILLENATQTISLIRSFQRTLNGYSPAQSFTHSIKSTRIVILVLLSKFLIGYGILPIPLRINALSSLEEMERLVEQLRHRSSVRKGCAPSTNSDSESTGINITLRTLSLCCVTVMF
jgi:hypothetical protein